MKLINLSNNAVLADKVKVADTFWKRLVGLLNRKSLDKREALILKPCSGIHTLFMRFPIDVLFLDKDNRVIGLLHSFKPFSFSPLYFNAVSAIEFPADTLQLTQTRLEDIIKIEE